MPAGFSTRLKMNAEGQLTQHLSTPPSRRTPTRWILRIETPMASSIEARRRFTRDPHPPGNVEPRTVVSSFVGVQGFCSSLGPNRSLLTPSGQRPSRPCV